MSNSNDPGKAPESQAAQYAEFLNMVRSSKTVTNGKSRKAVTPFEIIDAQLENWEKGMKPHFMVLRLLKSLIKQANVPEVPSKEEHVVSLLAARPELVAAMEALIADVVAYAKEIFSPYEQEVKIMSKSDAAMLELTQALAKAVQQKDRDLVAELQQKIADAVLGHAE